MGVVSARGSARRPTRFEQHCAGCGPRGHEALSEIQDGREIKMAALVLTSVQLAQVGRPPQMSAPSGPLESARQKREAALRSSMHRTTLCLKLKREESAPFRGAVCGKACMVLERRTPHEGRKLYA